LIYVVILLGLLGWRAAVRMAKAQKEQKAVSSSASAD